MIQYSISYAQHQFNYPNRSNNEWIDFATFQLRQVGLDLTFVLELMFHEDLVAAVEAHAKMGKNVIVKAVTDDKFVVVAGAKKSGTAGVGSGKSQSESKMMNIESGNGNRQGNLE